MDNYIKPHFIDNLVGIPPLNTRKSLLNFILGLLGFDVLPVLDALLHVLLQHFTIYVSECTLLFRDWDIDLLELGYLPLTLN